MAFGFCGMETVFLPIRATSMSGFVFPAFSTLLTIPFTAATNGEAAARIRAVLAEQVTARVIAVAGPDRAAERAALIATQILGLAYARYVMELPEELLPRGTMRVMIGATIQRYLFDDLPVQPS